MQVDASKVPQATWESEDELDDNPEDCRTECILSFSKITSSQPFETFFLTLTLGLLLYIADIGSDLANGIIYLKNDDEWWGWQTIGLVFLPGLVRGLYELFRRPIIYESATQTFKLKEDYGILRRLNFGLDVLPSLAINLPDSICIAVLSAPLYVVIMALWFPFLPIIQ